MRAETFPLRTLPLSVSGWVNRHQADAIAYLVEENKVLLRGPENNGRD
ncbi:MAG: hypothetical protein ACI82F_001218 [Planctomycetota bacterium]|jgi:hypothetical protein